MEAEYYSISMLAEKFEISFQGTDKKIKKFRDKKNKPLPTIKKVVDGREVTFYKITNEQLLELTPKGRVFNGDIEQVEQPVNKPIEQVYKQPNEQVEQLIHNQDYISLIKDVKELSLKAGKYELLEDKSRELKEDVKHWEGKYFELNHNCESLKAQKHQKEKWLIGCLFVALIFFGLFVYQLLQPPKIKEVTKVVYKPVQQVVKPKAISKKPRR